MNLNEFEIDNDFDVVFFDTGENELNYNNNIFSDRKDDNDVIKNLIY